MGDSRLGTPVYLNAKAFPVTLRVVPWRCPARGRASAGQGTETRSRAHSPRGQEGQCCDLAPNTRTLSRQSLCTVAGCLCWASSHVLSRCNMSPRLPASAKSLRAWLAKRKCVEAFPPHTALPDPHLVAVIWLTRTAPSRLGADGWMSPGQVRISAKSRSRNCSARDALPFPGHGI